MNTQNLEVLVKRCNALKKFIDNYKTITGVGLHLIGDCRSDKLDSATTAYLKNDIIHLLSNKVKELEEKIRLEVK